MNIDQTYNSKQKILSQLPHDVSLFLEKMREMGQKRNIPNISWNTASFFIDTLLEREVKNVLEIGPANGFSTMMLALACSKARITSIECSRHAFEELRHNLAIFDILYGEKREKRKEKKGGILIHYDPADLPPKISSDINQEKIAQFSLYYGDAREILPAFVSGAGMITCSNPVSIIQELPEERFDVIFIDGAFRMTREFFDFSRPLLAQNGLIILDDAIKYRWKMEGFHEYLEEQGIRYDLVQTDEDDGVMIIHYDSLLVLSSKY